MKAEQKEIIGQILELNPKAALSGSIALADFGFNLRREPEDIDIYLPHGESLKMPEGCTEGGEMHLGYHEPDFFITEFLLGDQKINIFQPSSSMVPPVRINEGYRSVIFSTVKWWEIVRFKIQHALDVEGDAQQKHKDDVIFFLQNNNPR